MNDRPMPNPADPKAIDISPEAVAKRIVRLESLTERGWIDGDIVDLVSALSAALSEARGKVGEAEWRPIETVPSGEEIFMAATAHGRIMIVRGSILATMMKSSTPDHLQFPAVAWKPLPSPPKDPAHD